MLPRFAALLCLPLLSACWGIDGNGRRVEEARVVAEFTAVDSRGELDVLVERGDAFSVVVSIDSNLAKYVDTRVVDGTLRIESDRWFDRIVDGPHVRVTLPHLSALTLRGSGDVDGFRFDETTPIELGLIGSGDLDFEGSAPLLTATLDGSGDLRLGGSAAQLNLDLDGSGDIHAQQCVASGAELRVDGSGNISATVNGPVSAFVKGSGDIDIYGAAVLVVASERGSGDIHVR